MNKNSIQNKINSKAKKIKAHRLMGFYFLM